MSDHERIWLEAECCADPDTGPLWCQDVGVFDSLCEHGNKATCYVRADLYQELESQLPQLRELLTEACAAAKDCIGIFAEQETATLFQCDSCKRKRKALMDKGE